MPPNRRAFLHHLQALGSMLLPVMGPQSAPAAMPLAGQLARLGALAALGTAARGVGAQGQGGDGDGYRAIVCLFLGGGNDAHNTLVPTDAASHASYSAPRRTLALPLMKLLPLATTGQDSGRTFGVPKELAPLLRWYNAGQCAFVANIGTLERPITQADVRAGRYLPRKLYSHNDQASVWQSGQPEGAPSGWGGRMGDLLMAQNAWPALTAVSVGGNVAFLNGRTLNQYRISPSGPVQVNAAQSGWHAGSTATPTALRSLLASGGANAFEREYLDTVRRSMDTTATLQAVLPGAGVPALPTTPTSLPSGGTLVLANDSLAQQLRMVAQLVACAPALGMRRQVFMVSLNGFDNHANHTKDHPLLLARLALGVDWFLNTLQARGQFEHVVLFTASEFGRALRANGDGCDHGWGGHHIVAGGSVKGGRIHGRFPTVAVGGPDDAGSGRLIPTTAVEQLAGDLGGWLGVGASELTAAVPGLLNFDSGAQVLG